MKKFELGSKEKETIRLEKYDDPQTIILENVAIDSKISIDYTEDRERREELVTTIGVPHLLEAVKKIRFLASGGTTPITPFNIVTIQVNEEGQPAKDVACLQHAFLPIALGGELKLKNNDILDVVLTDLQKVAQTTMSVVGGKKPSNQTFGVLTSEFDFDKSRAKDLDLAKIDYLIFNRLAIPDEIEFMYNGERKVMSREYILLMQKETFGVVGYSSKGVIMGTNEAVVLDLRDASSVTLRVDKTTTGKIDYFTVKL